ncbi:MAG: TolC family protein, partial [Candidatus Brocadiae bacterium]|nr:TolC family protein [Candidatus Brocadiia bacterium]
MSEHVSAAIVLALSCTVLAGCQGLSGRDPFLEMDVPPRRLRQIDPLDLEAMSADQEDPQAAPKELKLALGDCRVIALENNLDLKVELIRPTIAGEALSEQQAAFEPSLLANFTYTRSETPISKELPPSTTKALSADLGVRFPLRTGGTITFDLPFTRSETEDLFATADPTYTTDFSVSVSQPLLRNAGARTNTHAIRIAYYQSQIAEARAKLEVIKVIAAVDRVYWRLYAARRELEVRKNEYDLAVAQFERVRRMVAAGQVPEVEIVRAKTGVAERLEGIIIADNALRDRERELKRILNKPGLGMGSPTAIIPDTEPNPIHYDLAAGPLSRAALANRMEMLELELQIAQDASTIEYQRNQAWPILALDYTYNINGMGPTRHDAWDMLFDRRFEDHRLGLQLVLPIGNRAAASRLRRAVYTRVQRLATRDLRRVLIQQEVANTVDRLEATWQRILASRQRAIMAGRNLQAEERQFGQGLRTTTDVLEAQTRLADAQSAEIRALVEYQ